LFAHLVACITLFPLALPSALGAPVLGASAPGAAPVPAAADAELELVASYPYGDPATATVSTDEKLAFVAEGASITVLDLVPNPPTELRRIPVNASILGLLQVHERLFVCGGSHGLLVIDLTATSAGARVLDDIGEAVCTDAVRFGDRLAVTFALREGSQLRLYDLATLKHAETVPLPPGRAYALATDGDSLCIAMGTGGLVRVDFELASRPRMLPGPRGAAVFPPFEGFQLEPGLVRDVAILGRTLFAAVDAAGLASLSLDDPWLPDMPVTVSPLTTGGTPAYGVRVDAAHGRLAIALARTSVRQLEGAPYHPNGIVGTNLNVGGVNRRKAPTGSSEALVLFDTSSGTLERTVHELPGGGWLSLTLGRERIYEQHLGLGFMIRSVEGDEQGTVLYQRRPGGIPAIDGVTSIGDPRLVLFGTDFAGSTLAGVPRIDPDGSIQALPGELDSLGLIVSSQWLDDEGTEWFMGGGPLAWNLWRLEAGDLPRFSRWELIPPADERGVRGHTYFNSALYGDLLLLTRHGASTGALSYSAKAITDAARAVPAGSPLELTPLFELSTHDGGKRRSTWRTDFVTLEKGRKIAAMAAGFDSDPESPTHRLSRIVLFDVTQGTNAAPKFLAAAHGPEPGHAISIKLARYGDRALAFVGDLATGMLVFDITRPRKPRLTGRWHAPISPYDGQGANVLDVELAKAGGRRVAYLAAGREGLVSVDVTDPDSFELPTIATIDTPGLASGVAKTRIDGRRLLIVGDQRAGLRVYALP
jgi:hypothetical protein